MAVIANVVKQSVSLRAEVFKLTFINPTDDGKDFQTLFHQSNRLPRFARNDSFQTSFNKMDNSFLSYYLLTSALIFSIGLAVVVTKRNVIVVLMGIELMLNAVNLNLVAFSKNDPNLQGQMFAMFVIVVAVCESVVALAIILKVYEYFKTVNLDEISEVKET
jgi:NADH:ubiquinone oxidoreductase subunit K